MKAFIVIIILIFQLPGIGQTSFPFLNLVPDPGFELGAPRCDYYSVSCPGMGGCCTFGGGHFDNDLTFWRVAKINATCKGSPDYYGPTCDPYSSNESSLIQMVLNLSLWFLVLKL